MTKKPKPSTSTSIHMPKPMPWDDQMKALKKRAIDNEAVGVAKRLGAKCCVIIAMFAEGDNMIHLMDGGQSPIPTPQLYTTMLVNAQRGQQQGYIS